MGAIVMRRYIAFDIETAKLLPAAVPDLMAHRPLGICCAATYAHGEATPRVWHGRCDQNRPTRQMAQSHARELVEYLNAAVSDGFTVVTWNGLSFDFDILAEESGMWDECRELATHHVDIMYHFFCERGFPIALAKACDGMQLKGKSERMIGAHAPQAWADGRHEEVLEYNRQDVAALLDLAVACERRRGISWVTARGTTSTHALPSGLLTVTQATALPLPDTSWMDDPWPRSRFCGWLSSL